ncbi:MarR family transcriptional regulator [Saccharomonospora xinjiangensis]|uniref:MarR family winged helix-turn-helix transcriptional regulator n=1 Tax=Saccharomonospora xinjiangensis TaxID=75294 RepID=UPI0010703C37|nr:MarR family transcriptional regulator [Saccharomonospora xinjiangensis]QBQ59986.1 HTH-type transcriptional repressor NicR [Saccharomonospora xinjiangensis]
MATPPVPSHMVELPSWLLSQSALHAHRLVSEGLGEIGARTYHYRLLAALAEEGPASQNTLGRRCGIHASDLVATINELAEDGYVRRDPDPTDRRRNVVTLTAEGRRRLRRLDTTVRRIQDRVLAPLSAEERSLLSRLLRVLIDHHGNRPGSTRE